MSVYVFGNLNVEGLKMAFDPSIELTKITKEARDGYMNGENLFMTAETDEELREVIKKFHLPINNTKPVVVVSGFDVQVWEKIVLLLQEHGLSVEDVQWLVGVALNSNEMEEFKVEFQDNTPIARGGYIELQGLLDMSTRFIHVKGGQCQSMFVWQPKEKVTEREKTEAIAVLTVNDNDSLSKARKQTVGRRFTFITAEKRNSRIWLAGSMVHAFQESEALIGLEADVADFYKESPVTNMPRVALRKRKEEKVSGLIQLASMVGQETVVVLEVDYTGWQDTLSALLEKNMGGVITVKGVTQEQLVQTLKEYEMVGCLCVSMD
ncbi:hypothetical protein CN495_08115 [Bacillus thuringiensis]|uniref:Uncharacterized protein n=1 Tax=Bacillus thuringiensis TaxID=1428 RepID=A0ABD6SFJ5_BACTU|nr:hypothetical protein [Bacillus thuringiensis]PER55708.1 hypothetical protein CN495_08115 [Bacillus thuringiensis]